MTATDRQFTYPRSVHHITEGALRERALDYPCPTCGAAKSIRCRILTPNRTNPKRTTVDVRRRPCDERVTLAWRDMLANHSEETS